MNVLTANRSTGWRLRRLSRRVAADPLRSPRTPAYVDRGGEHAPRMPGLPCKLEQPGHHASRRLAFERPIRQMRGKLRVAKIKAVQSRILTFAQNATLILMYKLPPATSRKALYTFYNHRVPRMRSPVTFNEKVNWRILNDRRELLEFTCDKLAMKEFARDFSGVSVPQTLWFGTDIQELGNVSLPERWVLKPNHRSGIVYFGHGQPDLAALAEVTKDWLWSFESEELREWAYSKARPAFLVEELLGTPGQPPADYKFFVFAGEVAAIQMDVARHTLHRRRIYLPDWTPLEVKSGTHPLAQVEPPPANLERMLAVAREIGRNFDFIRVDLYSISQEVFFGEITPYAGSGFDRFVPASFDVDLGARWTLPPSGMARS